MTAQEKLAPLAAKLHAALADEKQRVKLLVCTGLAGLVLLGVTAWLPAGNSTQSPQTVQTDTAADYATQLESRLTALISRVEGAGKTAVMVTLESGSESIYATDTDSDGSSTHVLLGSGEADVSIVNTGVAVAVTTTSDPVHTKTTVSEIVLPFYERMDSTYVIKCY